MNRYLIVFIVIAAVASTLVLQPAATGRAQSIYPGWSKPQLLHKSSTQEIRYPQMAATPDGRVHLYWNQDGFPDAETPQRGSDPDKRVPPRVFYMAWDGNSWSRPTDVVIGTGLQLVAGTADPKGYLNVLVGGPMNRINHWRAPIADGGRAAAWAQVGPVDQAHPHGHLVVDGAGRLHRVYGGIGKRGSLHQLSLDSGSSWSTPRTVAPTQGPGAGADWVRVAVDEVGRIHVVWTEFQLPNGWPPLGVYYSRSEDGGVTWLPPLQMAGPGYDQIDVITYGRTVVHVAWNAMAGVTGRFHRWSQDSGKTWSDPVMVTAGSGTVGPPAMAVEGGGTLHFMTADDNAIFYARWQAGSWTSPSYVPSGDETGFPASGRVPDWQIRQIEERVMVLDSIGRLHAVFWDRRRQQNVAYLWHTMMETGSPPAFPAAIASPTATVTLAPTPRVTASASDPLDSFMTASRSETTAAVSRGEALSGIWIATFALVGMMAVRLVRRGSDR